jgi:integrase
VARFLNGKKDRVAPGRYATLHLHLSEFADWLGNATPVTQINGGILDDYRNVTVDQWKPVTAEERLRSVKAFVRWLWHIEAIPSLPRNLDGSTLAIPTPRPTIVTFTIDEISTLLVAASSRTELYILLMLNCAFTQKDIADLDFSEVDWDAGRIIRQRSKTRDTSKNVPEVSYLLWPRTLHLLNLHRNPTESGRVLLNEDGCPLWQQEVKPDGKLKKIDNVYTAFYRLCKKTGISKPPKSLKKTSASLLRSNGKYSSIRRLFLGRAPRGVDDRHYAAAPQDLLDDAIRWLGQQYGISE